MLVVCVYVLHDVVAVLLHRRGKAYLDNSDSHAKKVIAANITIINIKINLTTMSAAQAKTGIARTVTRTVIGERYTYTYALQFG
jgi:hypothetical protein